MQSEELRKEMTNLILARAKAIAAADAKNGSLKAKPDPDVVLMDPYIVRSRPPPDLATPKFEPPLEHFLRTGVIWQKVGEKTTKSLELHFLPPQNLSIPAPPRPRVEIGIHISF
jgi:hypothetical protein